MKRWIVNAAERTVREFDWRKPEPLGAEEFLYDAPTYADAMTAGSRRRLAEEALSHDSVLGHVSYNRFAITADRIECQASATSEIAWRVTDLESALRGLGFDVWREGTGLVVLGRLSG